MSYNALEGISISSISIHANHIYYTKYRITPTVISRRA